MMTRTWPKILDVDVDTREQKPLLFPKTITWHPDQSSAVWMFQVRTRSVRLDAGDYRLTRWPFVAGVERKYSASEIATNVGSDDYARYKAAITRFSETYRAPYLLLEVSPAKLLAPSPYVNDPERACDGLLRSMAANGLRLICAGGCKTPATRRSLGEFVVRLLWAHVVQEGLDRGGLQDAGISPE